MFGLSRLSTVCRYIPLAYLTADDAHGLYVGSEWELGSFQFDAQNIRADRNGLMALNVQVMIMIIIGTITQSYTT